MFGAGWKTFRPPIRNLKFVHAFADHTTIHSPRLEMGKLTHWAVVFSALAALYAVLGFGGVAGDGATVAKILCVLSLCAAIITLAGGWLRQSL